jgi:hypothetical protein
MNTTWHFPFMILASLLMFWLMLWLLPRERLVCFWGRLQDKRFAFALTIACAS